MRCSLLSLLIVSVPVAAGAQDYMQPAPAYPQAASAAPRYYYPPSQMQTPAPAQQPYYAQPQQPYAAPAYGYAPRQPSPYEQATQSYLVPQPTGEMPAQTAYSQPSAPVVQSHRPNWYFNVHGELSWVADTDLKIGGGKVGTLEMDLEYAAGVAIGWQPSPDPTSFLGNTRYELELMYREVDFNNLTGSTIAPGGFGGSEESYVAMLNAFYDFDTGTSITPYIGMGLGMAYQMFDSITIQTDDTDTVFAYQGMLGLAYTIPPYQHTKIGLGYRYFGTMDAEFENRTGQSVEHTYDGHNLEAFLRVPF